MLPPTPRASTRNASAHLRQARLLRTPARLTTGDTTVRGGGYRCPPRWDERTSSRAALARCSLIVLTACGRWQAGTTRETRTRGKQVPGRVRVPVPTAHGFLSPDGTLPEVGCCSPPGGSTPRVSRVSSNPPGSGVHPAVNGGSVSRATSRHPVACPTRPRERRRAEARLCARRSTRRAPRRRAPQRRQPTASRLLSLLAGATQRLSVQAVVRTPGISRRGRLGRTREK